METEWTRLERDLRALHEDNAALRARVARAERRLRALGGASLVLTVGAVLVAPAASPAFAQSFGVTLNQLLSRVTALEADVRAVEGKTRFVRVEGTEMIVEGANLHIRNGLGATNGNRINPLSLFGTTTNGLGNLVIGYNERFFDLGEERGGSHNLVLGTLNEYTSFGGIVAGRINRITAPLASTLSGSENEAVGIEGVVVGGLGNRASGPSSAVLAGQVNVASGIAASVSGGVANQATGAASSVAGGSENRAEGNNTSISGGRSNVAQGFDSSVSGGRGNRAGANFASVLGGTGNTASGAFACVSGGIENVASGSGAAVSGGQRNTASGETASVSGGQLNSATGGTASVAGGQSNVAGGAASVVSGGLNRSTAFPFDWRAGGLFQEQ